MEIVVGPQFDEGGYSVVRSCKVNDEDHVVKIITNENVNLIEPVIMASIVHPNIKSSIQTCCDEESLYIFQTREESNLSEQQPTNIKEALFGIVNGIAALHKLGIVHGDIKSSNILFTDHVVITDFGMSSFWDPKTKKCHSRSKNTYNYRPMEILTNRDRYGYPIDIWALGCLIWETITRSCMFPIQNVVKGQVEQNRQRHMNAILDFDAWIKGQKKERKEEYVKPNFDVDIPKDVLDLIKFIMVIDQNYRPTIFDIAKHPYFEGFTLTEPKIKRCIPRSIDDKEKKRLTFMFKDLNERVFDLYSRVAFWYKTSDKDIYQRCQSLLTCLYEEKMVEMDLASHLGFLLL